MAGFGYGGHTRRWDAQNWSLTAGWVLGIRVRLHGLFLVFIAYDILFAYGQFGVETVLYRVLPFEAILFATVLLHEFGHCFGCRAVGGMADDVLLWPLGGLAYVHPPHRPDANLVTAVAGPAVNVLIMALTWPMLFLIGGIDQAELWNPFGWGLPLDFPSTLFYVGLTFKVSYWLLLFNLLPFFPMDGGRVLQGLLWSRLGHYRATLIAANLGMLGAVGVGLIAIWYHEILLAGVALFGLVNCLKARRDLEVMGETMDNEFGYDFSQGYTSLERSMRGTKKRTPAAASWRQRFRRWAERRKQQNERLLEQEVDRILAKIQEQGMNSLTRSEKRTLHQASKKRRQPR